MEILGGVGCTLLLLPSVQGRFEPISNALARFEFPTIIGLILLISALLLAGKKLHRVTAGYGTALCGLLSVDFLLIAATDPDSSLHLGIFVCLTANISSFLWTVAYLDRDGPLMIYCTAGTLACILCGANLGVGERFLLLTSAGGMAMIYKDARARALVDTEAT